MPKKCTNTQPSIRLRIHSPANPIHDHVDNTVEVKGETDWAVWGKVMAQCLTALGYTDDRLVLGFYLDLVNGLPDDLRLAMLKGIVGGYGLQVEQKEEEGETHVQAGLVTRYTPLNPQKSTSGLVVPESQKPGILVPGDPGFKS